MGWASSQLSLKPGCDKLLTGQLIPCNPEALMKRPRNSCFSIQLLYFGSLPMLQGLPPNFSDPPTANYATSPLSAPPSTFVRCGAECRANVRCGKVAILPGRRC